MNILQSAGSPQAALESIISANPQLRALVPLINKNGGDYRKTFYDLAAQKGIDPNEILNLVKVAT